MSIRIPSVVVILLSVGVGILAVLVKNPAIAAVCFSIAALYAAVVLWRWRRRKKDG